jgi:GNAT superfamily N-acetyltransferase
MNAPVDPLHTSDYAFVPARSVDDARLLAFAAAAWPDRPAHDRILSSWWRRAEPGCAVAAVEQAGGAMTGICAVRPAEWIIAGGPVSAVAICEWYVAPHHAGKGIGKRMVQRLAKPGQLVYAFSISDAAIANFRKLGWKGPGGSSLLVLPLPGLASRLLRLVTANRGVELHDHVLAASDGLAASDELADLGRALDVIEARRARDAAAHMRRGAADWAWRLSVCGERAYHACVARVGGEPAGYVVVRKMTRGSSRMLGRIDAALITDLVAVDDDPAVLRALAVRAAAIAARLGAMLLLMATTDRQHRTALVACGFLSSGLPVLGPMLERRAPAFMWSPDGPGNLIDPDDVTFTFADSDVDLNL